MLPPIGPALISAAIGAGDALLADTDVKNNRTTAGKAYTTWGQAAVAAVGLLIGATRVGGLGNDVSEPMVNTALALGARNVTFRMLTRGASPAVPAYGRLAARPAAPAVHAGHARGDMAYAGADSAPHMATAQGFLRQATLPTI